MALIVGAMKCGSTGLFNVLSQHPQLCGCIKKEPDFFSSDEHWSQGLGSYKSLWPDFDRAHHKWALEASVSYTYGIPNARKVISNLQQTHLQARFIFIVRDPIERVESHYTHAFVNRLPLAKFPLTNGVPPFLLEVSRYATLIDMFANAFGRERVLVVDFARFRNERANVLDDIASFLEIDSFDEAGFQDAKNNPTSGKIRLNLLGRSLLPFRKAIPYLPNSVVKTGRKILGAPIEERFKMTDMQRAGVLNDLQYELDYLSNVYGIDTRGWIEKYR